MPKVSISLLTTTGYNRSLVHIQSATAVKDCLHTSALLWGGISTGYHYIGDFGRRAHRQQFGVSLGYPGPIDCGLMDTKLKPDLCCGGPTLYDTAEYIFIYRGCREYMEVNLEWE